MRNLNILRIYANVLCKNNISFQRYHKCLTHVKILTAQYKSEVNVEKLYPNSNLNFLRKLEQTETLSQSQQQEKAEKPKKEPFTGYIPIENLQITTSRSSGPGGQNVNKVNSKVEIRFHLESANWIPEWIKPKLADQESGRLTKDGFLVVQSDMTRKQMLNQADCLNKIRKMIYGAAVEPREPTKEEIELREERQAKAKAGILREKKIRSSIKQSRSSPQF
ncbi:large ribosomal subunit protein mL62-like [Physella acuta]|uniref:large ribosomal subunit protein mL62-like n=1 Tax=Physella acuta TaxID=109671 RepID=UPI0027DB4A29|nr:large ribosomal subunit protein mL62-like [Physella acuta]